MSEENARFIMSNRAYDTIKWLVQIVLPASATAYFALAGIYGWDNAEQVVGTLAVVTTFLGTLLGISTRQYNKSDAQFDGVVDIIENEGAKTFSLGLNVDPDQIDKRESFKLKVNPLPEE